MWGPDVPVVDPHTAVRRFGVAVASFVAFGFTVKYFLTLEPPVVRREYPYNGLVKELGGLEENKVSFAELFRFYPETYPPSFASLYIPLGSPPVVGIADVFHFTRHDQRVWKKASEWCFP